MNTKKKLDAFKDKSIKVPFIVPDISKSDVKSIIAALKSTLLTDGPQLRQFELNFSKFTGAKYAIGVSNATAALQLSLKALGIGKGDEVIIPDMTFAATANAVIFTGATPVIVDIEKSNMNISIDSIKSNLTKKTKAILLVHFAGKICDINKIKNFARSNNLFLIEDCAHAIGTKFENKHVGIFGNVGCFSFYPTKNITTLEGGMVITNSKKIADYIISARNHGISKTLKQRFSKGKPWDYDIIEPGYNFRLDEVRSSLGISQLNRVKKLNLLRKKACKYYNKKLQQITGIETPSLEPNFTHSCHLYIVKIQKKYGHSRDELFKKLLKKGIRTSVHYKPLHKFTAFRKKARLSKSLKNSKEVYNEIISLPLYPGISKIEQNYVINCIKNFSKK